MLQKTMASVRIGFPDTGIFFAPPFGIPIIVPFPNFAPSLIGNPRFLSGFLPGTNVVCLDPMSVGSVPPFMGVACGMDFGPVMDVMCSFRVIQGGTPTTRITDPELANLINNPIGISTPTSPRLVVLA